MDIKQRVGMRVKSLGDKAGLSVLHLAWDSDLDPAYIYSVIRGERNLSLTSIQKISNAVGIYVWEFFNDDLFN